jgi:hypothetical protein
MTMHSAAMSAAWPVMAKHGAWGGNLMGVLGIRVKDLHQEFREKDVPDDLALVLEQAGRADVRLLIFDGDAPVLDGLPVYPE